ncbi:acetylcholine receptor subunit alpha [Plakobranchus ocellatus]|uniref:Acetylcholine receptor subunit alpha n=1 Tax=Plakobranchus ocellatus TaxID=259542 RepID=A0AAV4DX35_9GAST|nr:acetylcholine receptor subunit alpha [Plakobranchus ocellatus]
MMFCRSRNLDINLDSRKLLTSGKTSKKLKKLEQALFKNYSATIRPVRNQKNTVRVTASFLIINVLQIDEVEQIFSINGALLLRWRDELTDEIDGSPRPEWIRHDENDDDDDADGDDNNDDDEY